MLQLSSSFLFRKECLTKSTRYCGNLGIHKHSSHSLGKHRPERWKRHSPCAIRNASNGPVITSSRSPLYNILRVAATSQTVNKIPLFTKYLQIIKILSKTCYDAIGFLNWQSSPLFFCVTNNKLTWAAKSRPLFSKPLFPSHWPVITINFQTWRATKSY